MLCSIGTKSLRFPVTRESWGGRTPLRGRNTTEHAGAIDPGMASDARLVRGSQYGGPGVDEQAERYVASAMLCNRNNRNNRNDRNTDESCHQ